MDYIGTNFHNKWQCRSTINDWIYCLFHHRTSFPKYFFMIDASFLSDSAVNIRIITCSIKPQICWYYNMTWSFPWKLGCMTRFDDTFQHLTLKIKVTQFLIKRECMYVVDNGYFRYLVWSNFNPTTLASGSRRILFTYYRSGRVKEVKNI